MKNKSKRIIAGISALALSASLTMYCDMGNYGSYIGTEAYAESICELTAWSLTLDGRIGVNLYFDSAPDSLTVNGETVSVVESDGMYKATYYLAAKELSRTLTINYNDTNIEKTALDLLETYSEDADESVSELAVSLLDYSKAADEYFSGESVNYDNSFPGTDASYDAVIPESLPDGIIYSGSSLCLESDTYIRHYFTSDEIEKFSFFIDDEEVTPVEKDGMYYIETNRIAANKLGVPNTIRITDGENSAEIVYSALSYANIVLASETRSENIKNLCKTIYDYSNAAINYLGTENNNEENEDLTDLSFVKINEICASNKTCLEASNKSYPDWIELYNTSTEAIDISGVGLSDGKKKRYIFTFPENTIIEAESYIVVLCDEDYKPSEGDTEFYALFNISDKDKAIYLTAPLVGEENGKDIDVVPLYAAPKDNTYARKPDGSDSFAVLAPTPGASNNDAEVKIQIGVPEFSDTAGFYDDAFELSLIPAEDCTIMYTTDGSDPRESDTAIEYTVPINIYDNTSDANVCSAVENISLAGYTPPADEDVEKGIVVKAVCKDANGLYSDVATNTYFVGKDKSYYRDMKVVSLSTDFDNLFGDDNGIYVVGTYFEQWKNSSNYVQYSSLNSSSYPTNYNQSGKDWERPANIQVFENGLPVYTSNIGVRIAGNNSRGYNQKSLKLYARGEYGSSKMNYTWITDNVDINGNVISSYDKIIIRNTGSDVNGLHMRDVVNQELAKETIVSGQDSEECILFINGEFWGLYDITEFIDENYIEENFDIDKNDCTIYKIGSSVAAGDPELWDEYCGMVDYLSTTDISIEENYDILREFMDVNVLMDYIAFQTYICNDDWSKPTGNNNFITWRKNTSTSDNDYSDGKWRCLIFDTDITAGWNADSSYSTDRLNNMRKKKAYSNVSYIFYKLMENESFRNEFREVYTDMVSDIFAPEKVLALVDEKVDLRYDATMDTFRRYSSTASIEKYDGRLNNYKEFWEKRPGYAMQHLETLFAEYEGA